MTELDYAKECLRWIDYVLSKRAYLRDEHMVLLSTAYTTLIGRDTKGFYVTPVEYGKHILDCMDFTPVERKQSNSLDRQFLDLSIRGDPNHELLNYFKRSFIAIDELTSEIAIWILKAIKLFSLWTDAINGTYTFQEVQKACDNSPSAVYSYFIRYVISSLRQGLTINGIIYDISSERFLGVLALIDSLAMKSAVNHRAKLAVAFRQLEERIVHAQSISPTSNDSLARQVLSTLLSDVTALSTSSPNFERLSPYARPFRRYIMMDIATYRWFQRVLELFTRWASILHNGDRDVGTSQYTRCSNTIGMSEFELLMMRFHMIYQVIKHAPVRTHIDDAFVYDLSHYHNRGR